MKHLVHAGSTSWVSELFIQDSSSTTGAGKTGLRPDTASLKAYYKRNNGTAAVQITLGTITTLGTFVSGGFKEVDSTNMPGIYEFDPPDASIADGATSVVYLLQGATNMAPCALEAQLIHPDPQDGVRWGLTALPNAAAEAAGGLYTRGSGAGQINQAANGQIDANLVRINNVAATTASAQLGVNVVQMGSTTVSLDANNLLKVDTEDWKGTAVVAPATVGIPDINVKNIANAAVNTASAQIGTNVVSYAAGQAPLQPTVAGRTLDVTATGAGGIDWGNLENPTTTNTLSGTTIGSVTVAVDVSANGRTNIGSATWDVTLSSHLASGSTGAALNAAGAAGDPWQTNLPGAYVAGQAGFIVGTNVDATISSRLAPVVSGRTLKVSDIGTAAPDWANIGSPTTTVNLSGTTIKTATDVETRATDIQSRLPAALTGGRMDSSVGAYQTGLTPLQPVVAGRTVKVSDVGTIAPDWANVGSPATVVNLSNTTISAVSGAVGSVTGNVGGNVTGSVGSVSGAVGSVSGNVTGNVTGSIGSLAAQAQQDVLTSAQNALGSTTWTQPGQASPPATQTLVGMSAYIYKSMRNKVTQSSTTFQLFNDDNATVDQKAAVTDDGTTFTRAKLTTGP